MKTNLVIQMALSAFSYFIAILNYETAFRIKVEQVDPHFGRYKKKSNRIRWRIIINANYPPIKTIKNRKEKI